MRKLWKTTVVIWSEKDLSMAGLEYLGRDATQGESYCSKMDVELVEDPESDNDWDGTEFFMEDD